MAERLKDKIAIVTGAGRGVGAATACLFAREGARVVLASRTLSQVQSVADRINACSGKNQAVAVEADVRCEQQVESLFQCCVDEFGAADILVNNAGAVHVAPIWETSLEDFRSVMDTNVQGVFLCSRAAFLQMKRNAVQGSIIHVGSLAGIRGTEKFPGLASYVASKHAVVGLTESLSVEGRPFGIRVNCVAPGAVDTQMLREAAPHLNTETTPTDIARSILFFASAQSESVTGSILEIHSNA